MDKSDQLADLDAQIAREQASLLQLHIMKETLQSEVVAKQEELERVWVSKENNKRNTDHPRRNRKQDRSQIPIVQVYQTTFSMIQTGHPQVYQPETIFLWMNLCECTKGTFSHG